MTEPMFWGFDTATRVTGWTCGTGAERPTVGVFKYDHVGSRLGQLAKEWRRDLCALEARFGTPKVIAYEAPLLTPGDKLLTLRKLYGMGMVLEDWAAEEGVRDVHVVEVGNGAIKKRIAGHFRAKKPELVRVVRTKLGITLPEGDAAQDAADSFGAWLSGCIDHYAKHHQPRWDAALYGSRGALL